MGRKLYCIVQSGKIDGTSDGLYRFLAMYEHRMQDDVLHAQSQVVSNSFQLTNEWAKRLIQMKGRYGR